MSGLVSRGVGVRAVPHCALALLALALTVACAPASQPATGARAVAPAAAAAPTAVPSLDVTVAIPSQSLSTFPLTLGQDVGLYQRHGINLSVVPMASNAAIAAVVGGSADYATPAGSVIRAINQGAPMKVVTSIADRSNHILIVDPSVVREGKDLAGKTIAVNEVGGNEHLEAQATLQRYGLDKDNANIIGINSNQQKLTALQTGAAQAVITNVPFNFPAAQMGYVVLANLADFYELPTSLLGTSDGQIATTPAAVQRMVTATLEAIHYARSERGEAVQAIARQYEISEEQAAAAYDLVRDIWSPSGDLSAGAYRNATEPLALERVLPMDAVLDRRFLDAAR